MVQPQAFGGRASSKWYLALKTVGSSAAKPWGVLTMVDLFLGGFKGNHRGPCLRNTLAPLWKHPISTTFQMLRLATTMEPNRFLLQEHRPSNPESDSMWMGTLDSNMDLHLGM